MYEPQTSTAEANNLDSTGQVQMPFSLPTQKNYARDEEMVKTCDDLWRLCESMRNRRRSLEAEWMAIRNMVIQQHDDGRRYMGRSAAYLPVFSKTRSTLVSTMMRGLFPSDDYMEVYDRGLGDTEQSRALKEYLRFELETNAQVPRHMKPGLGQFVDSGNGVFKFWWNKELRPRVGMQRMVGGIYAPQYGQDTSCEGLRFASKDLFNVYVYPETASDPREVMLTFEDILVSRAFIEQMGRLKRWENIEDALNSYDNNPGARQLLLQAAAGMPDPVNFEANTIADLFKVTEVWCHLKLPSSAYLPGENKEAPVPARVVLANNKPVLVERNQLFHQSHPYLWARQGVMPSLFYGQGQGRMVRWLQYLANDFANQMNDVGIYSLNPISKINPAYIIGPPPAIRPGVTWKMTNIKEGHAFDRPPVELAQHGQNLMGQYISMVQDFGGAPQVLQGTGANKGAKTATGAQILQANALSPLQDIIEDLERDICVPLMRGTWALAQQFREQEVILRVAGMPLVVQPSDLYIDAGFRWLASNQAVNRQQRTMAMMQFIQTMMPLVPLLNMQGKIFDPTPMLRRIYNDGLGQRGFDDVIRPAAAGPMPVSAGPQGYNGMPQGAPQSPANAEQYATMQNVMGGLDMVPGEGEDFASVRGQADELSAMMGDQMGGFH